MRLFAPTLSWTGSAQASIQPRGGRDNIDNPIDVQQTARYRARWIALSFRGRMRGATARTRPAAGKRSTRGVRASLVELQSIPETESTHDSPVVGPPSAAGGGVLRPRLAPSLPTSRHRRADERFPVAMVSALYRRRRNHGGGRVDTPRHYAHSAVAGALCGRRLDDCDDQRDDLSYLAR